MPLFVGSLWIWDFCCCFDEEFVSAYLIVDCLFDCDIFIGVFND